MNRKMRDQLRLVLLTAACGSAVSMSQESIAQEGSAETGFAEKGFIVQPKLRQRVEAEASTRVQAAEQVATHSDTTLVLTAPQTSMPSNRTQDSTASFVSDSRGARVSNASQTNPAAHGPELQWVTRGTFVSGTSTSREYAALSRTSDPSLENRTHTRNPTFSNTGNQTIEFDNPEFFAPQTLAQPQAASQPAMSESTSLQTVTPEDEERKRRAVVAELVSKKIIGDVAEYDQAVTIPATDSMPGWQAVGERLTNHLKSCEASLRHSAYASARKEVELAAIYLVRILDLANNSYDAEPTWHAALRALQEADDFSMIQRMSIDTDSLKRIIDSHETTVLKGADTRDVSPLVAAEHYRKYAEQQLVRASQDHPWASDVYYSMGRTFQAQAESVANGSDALKWKAVTFYRAAVTVSPRNSIASNQLGYILLQMDRPQDAREALVASLSGATSVPALENLVEASRRLRDPATHQWAVQQLATAQRMLPPQADAPQVTELSPRDFITISPRSSGPQAQGNPPTQLASGYSDSPNPGAIQR
jgi:tetratricopeptide (TPR) repeat protein